MLSVRGVSKSYETAGGTLPILDGVSMELSPGDAVCILGPSGSGKSTLLFILGALEAPTAGSVSLGGQDPFAMPEAERAAFRNRHVGFVFQDHCLLPQCSVLEALACGVPVVQPDHGAFPEIVARTAGGVLFPPGDADALARELRALQADPARRHALGVRGARGVREEYSAARMAERALAVYEEAIAAAC